MFGWSDVGPTPVTTLGTFLSQTFPKRPSALAHSALSTLFAAAASQALTHFTEQLEVVGKNLKLEPKWLRVNSTSPTFGSGIRGTVAIIKPVVMMKHIIFVYGTLLGTCLLSQPWNKTVITRFERFLEV